MKIYDKVQWHIDGGENRLEVISKFQTIFSFFNEYNFLTAEGKNF